MTTFRKDRLEWRRGCLVVIGLVLLMVAALALYFLSSASSWAPSSGSLRIAHAAAEGGPVGGPELDLTPIDLRLDLTSVQLILRPDPSLEGLVVRSEHDPQRYDLTVDEEDSGDGGQRLVVRMEPRSKALAFVRMKVGGDLPRLVIELPPSQPLRINGSLATAFGAFELGGLSISDFAFEVDGGGATVSLLEPLRQPMQSFELIGDKGSLEVTGLGHASPRRAVFRQTLGELDLDLRGAWQRDASVDVDVTLAGGSCWLPGNVDVVGRGGGRTVAELPMEAGVDPRPTLDLRIEEHGGRMVVIE